MFSELPLRPTDIGLILSYRCQSACRHCVYNCGPSWEDWMDPDEIPLALSSMRVGQKHLQVHITGGEPFLNFDLMLTAVKSAAKLEIPCYIETNAGWCTDARSVERKFRILKEAGLQALMISCSPFHAETIPLNRTFMAIDRALDIFGPRGVMVYLPDWIDQIRRFGTRSPVSINCFIESYGIDPTGLMLWDGYSLNSGGRAGYRLGFLADLQPPNSFQSEVCRMELLFSEHSHYDLYGQLVPYQCGGISLGSWKSIQKLLDDYEGGNYPPLIDILVNQGPYGLYKFARQEYDYQPIPAGYAGKCHLCVDIRSHLYVHANYPELQPGQFYRDLQS